MPLLLLPVLLRTVQVRHTNKLPHQQNLYSFTGVLTETVIDEDGTERPVKRRVSISRQLQGKYQRTTNRKVEGREIQQVCICCVVINCILNN